MEIDIHLQNVTFCLFNYLLIILLNFHLNLTKTVFSYWAVGDLISYIYPELIFIGINEVFLETINNVVSTIRPTTEHNINYIQFLSPDTISHVRKYYKK